jgi:uncharacterized repeat protein (TIGR02543 family)
MLHKFPWRKLLSPLLAGWWSVIACHGQTSWRSTLYPNNWVPPSPTVSFASAKLIQDFSYAGYQNGAVLLPSITGPVFRVADYGAVANSTSDSTVAIQNAINAAAAAGGGVVLFPAGTFRVSPQGSNSFALRISTSNIVLRGAGATQTLILNTSVNMRSCAVILVSPNNTNLGTAQSVTANLPGPTHRIPVENAGSFSPGNIVRLQWTFTPDWVTENNQQTWWGAAQPSPALYFRQVTAVNAAEGWIELDVPTRYWIKTRDTPTVRTVSGLLREVGIESLGISNVQNNSTTGWGEEDYQNETRAAYHAHASWLIRCQHVRDSWITNVRSQVAGNTRTCHMLSNGVLLLNCLRMTLQNCQMRRPQYGGGGGNGYMYRIQNSNECLLRDCLADYSRHGFVISHAGTSGNVFLQCEDRETARAVGGSSAGYTTSGSGSDNHMHFSHSNLWDQCHANNSFFTAHHRGTSGSSPSHGVTSAHAVYWNTSGSGSRYSDASNPIVRSEQLNFGYIIGTRSTDATGSYFTSRPTGGGTSPQDHLEGVNTGAGLQPQSLYLDQISRRLRPTITFNANGGSAAASKQVIFGETYGALPVSSRSGFTFLGWFTALTGGTQVTADTTVTNSANHSLFARWNAWPTVNAGPDQDLATASPLPWTPQLLVAAAWYDAADPQSLEVINHRVVTWRDKSGRLNHASQGNASRRPVTGGASIGGLNAVAFDPFLEQHLIAPHHASLNLDGSGGANLFAVFQSQGYVSRGSGLNSIVSKGPLLAADASYGIRVNTNGHFPFKAGADWVASPADAYLSQDILYGATRNDRTLSAVKYIDGTETGAASAVSSVSNNNSALILGGESALTRCAAVQMGELLVLPGLMTAGTRQAVEGYLAHKWMLAAKLPLNHPYKLTAPAYVATVTLAGQVLDAENDPHASSWEMVSGPAPVAFRQASDRNTVVYFPVAGEYVLRLSVAIEASERSDDIAISVVEAVHPFVTWTGGNSSFVYDTNDDGLADGLAWLLGAAAPTTPAAAVMPRLQRENGELTVRFRYLNQAAREGHAMRLQYSTTLAPGSWTDVAIPENNGTVGGFAFTIQSLPGTHEREVRATVPNMAAGRIFIRMAAEAP